MLVRSDGNEQNIALAPRMFEMPDMAEMQQIERAVSMSDLFSGSTNFISYFR
jgi:hypothetical protein